MFSLSLWEPWAYLVYLGAKAVETRSWATRYRGPLIIHAAKRFTADERAYCIRPFFMEALRAGGIKTFKDLPLGAALCVVNLADVRRTEEVRGKLSAQEIMFGNYNDGRYAWIFDRIYPYVRPIAMAGKQGLYRVEHPVPRVQKWYTFEERRKVL